MNKTVLIISCIIASIVIAGCVNEKGIARRELSSCERSFFGDTAAVFFANELQNGYRVSIIHNEQLDLIHFERGDSISRYCAIHKLPDDLRRYEEDSVGVFHVDLNFPVLKLDTIGGRQEIPDMFFMDVNFDGEEDFIVRHEGYNRFYYACFDLVKGNYKSSCPGLLESISDKPYNNIVSGIAEQPAYTVFDYKKKEIYVYETMGCCSCYETWAKYFDGDEFGYEAGVKVYREIHHDWYADGTEHDEIYKLVNDTLKLVEKRVSNDPNPISLFGDTDE